MGMLVSVGFAVMTVINVIGFVTVMVAIFRRTRQHR